MKKFLFPVFLILALATFSQQNKYWIKFKDKDHNAYSTASPQQFLSQASIDRRVKQGISLNEGDLPITRSYEDSVAPFISKLDHHLKWFNLIVADIEDAGMVHTDTLEQKNSVNINDTFSITIYDSIVIHYKTTVTLSGTLYDTLTFAKTDTVFDSVSHAGPVLIRDSIFLTDVSTGNKFDSIKKISVVDSMGLIATVPPRISYKKEKFEEISPVDQRIIYPSLYGAAYHQINMLNADLLHQMGYKGDGIVISMMDNGFYNANNIGAYDSVRSNILGTWDFVNNESDVYNDGSHGENTFSCIGANRPGKMIGTAPHANFYLLVTEDNSAEWVMEEYNWAAAAEFADSAGAQIFSTSLGYTTFDNGIGSHSYSDLTGDQTLITRAANIAASKGILVLNSAGNEGAGAWHYISAPGDGDSVLAIGAVDSAEQVTNFSGRGPNASGRIKPDICSQGAGSAVVQTDGSVGYSNGTSFSCPIMSGCVASLWSAFPDKSAKEIRDAIMISANHFWTPDNNHGYGIPNFYTAYLLLKTDYNEKILRLDDDAVVYPNPFTSELNITLFNTYNTYHLVEMFDMLGRKVYSEMVFVRDNTFGMMQPSVHALSPGKYILVLDGKKDFTHLLIKAK